MCLALARYQVQLVLRERELQQLQQMKDMQDELQRAEEAALNGSARPATTRILGYSSQGPSPDSNETFRVLNRQRELTLLQSTAAPTATSCAFV